MQSHFIKTGLLLVTILAIAACNKTPAPNVPTRPSLTTVPAPVSPHAALAVPVVRLVSRRSDGQEGTVELDGTEVLSLLDANEVKYPSWDIKPLSDALRLGHTTGRSPGPATAQDRRIVIEVDPDVPYRVLKMTVATTTRNGFGDVVLRTTGWATGQVPLEAMLPKAAKDIDPCVLKYCRHWSLQLGACLAVRHPRPGDSSLFRDPKVAAAISAAFSEGERAGAAPTSPAVAAAHAPDVGGGQRGAPSESDIASLTMPAFSMAVAADPDCRGLADHIAYPIRLAMQPPGVLSWQAGAERLFVPIPPLGEAKAACFGGNGLACIGGVAYFETPRNFDALRSAIKTRLGNKQRPLGVVVMVGAHDSTQIALLWPVWRATRAALGGGDAGAKRRMRIVDVRAFRGFDGLSWDRQ